MKQHLNKIKKRGFIDFIEVPLNWGNKNKEFIVIDLKKKEWFIIFFDHKYRQDKYSPNIKKEEDKLAELADGLKDIGMYNTRKKYDEQKKIVEFIKKYKTT